MKKIISAITAFICGIICFTSVFPTGINETAVCASGSLRIETDGAPGSNASANDYVKFRASPVNSLLTQNSDGSFSRVEYVAETGSIVAETIGIDGKVKSSAKITMELPIWGGVYSGSSNNFIVFGNKNTAESDKTEVLRIVKYSKDWKKISACSVYGANTVEPFYGGSLRMTESGGLLYIHTCHTMYFTDGANHEANMIFVINESTMKVSQSYSDIYNIKKGYVSHSFNQFIRVDGSNVYRVDHGDAEPRSVVITKAPVGSVTKCSNADILKIGGSYTTNGNGTGVSVGGFELSDSNCITVGNSVDQSANPWVQRAQRNIFVGVSSRSDLSSKVVWLTDYPSDGEITVCTPHLVKMSSNKFAVLWEEKTPDNEITVKIAVIDGSGKVLSKPVSLYARLSDCPPIVTSDGKIAWYVAENDSPIIYSIDLNDVSLFRQEDEWSYDPDTKTLTIYGTGRTRDYAPKGQPWNEYYLDIRKIVVSDGITALGNNIFYGIWYITDISLPDSLTSIGTSAFRDCYYLRSAVIPDSVEKIGGCAFFECNAMESIDLGKGISTIGDRAIGYEYSSDRPETIDGYVVYGYKGTAAESYAKANGLEFKAKDDIQTTTTTTTTTTTATTTTASTRSTTVTTPPPVIERGDGDISGDGKTDLSDAVLLRRYLMNIDPFTRSQTASADMNGDGAVNAFDMCIMREYVISAPSKVSRGDIITMGKCMQDSLSLDKQDIEWVVLDVKGDAALVISRYAIDAEAFNDTETETDWEHCTLRKYLNSTFISETFTKTEQSRILTTINTNPDNSDYGTPGGNSTNDRVFPLSAEEAEKYFSSDEERCAAATSAAIGSGAFNYDGYTYWGLRTPGIDSMSVSLVSSTGDIYLYGYSVDYERVALRPAMWIYIY